MRPSAFAVLRLMTNSYLVGGLYRQVGRLFTFEDAIDVDGRKAVLTDQFRPIGHQATNSKKRSIRIDRGKSMLCRERDDQIAVDHRWGGHDDNQTAIGRLRKLSYAPFNFHSTAQVDGTVALLRPHARKPGSPPTVRPNRWCQKPGIRPRV